jgi:hypothetical protein
LNELLDFVRLDPSLQPELSPLILLHNIPTAAWRFIRPNYQYSKMARAHIIQATSSFNSSCASQGAGQVIQAFDLYQSTGI